MKHTSIYMDVCCLNRPFDDQSQHRVYLESETILSILSLCKESRFELVGSDTIDYELSKHSDIDKFKKVQALYSVNNRVLLSNREIFNLSVGYRTHGIKVMDSLHLATAVHNKVDVLLTTDDSFLHNAEKLNLAMRVSNPVTWFMEVVK